MADLEETRELLKQRLAAIEERIRLACARAGRKRGDVTLVAVTKTVPAEVAGLLPELGIVDLGERRPQELWRKAEIIQGVHWHLVGHLQRNKVERTLPVASLIHSVDSERLLTALEQEAERRQQTVSVLLEINASQEAAKHGFAAHELPRLLPALAKLHWVRVQGLMTMAAFAEDPELCRPAFASIRAWRDRLRADLPSLHDLHHLSMGMSNDFEVAIAEGATLVRIGTALLGDLADRPSRDR